MKVHALDGHDWLKAIGVGIGVSAITATFMAATMKAGVSPLPKSLGLAFAETILGRTRPLPVGLLFHTVWVTTFSVLYVVLFRDGLWELVSRCGFSFCCFSSRWSAGVFSGLL